MSVFGQNLKLLRLERGMSQQELSEKTGVTRLTISNYEQGRREPDFGTLCGFADFFNCSTDFLLGRQTALQEDEALTNELKTLHAQCGHLLPSEREFILRALNDMLSNYIALSSATEYRRQQLFSVLAINMSANSLSSFVLAIRRLVYNADGSKTVFDPDETKERIQNLADMSYNAKIEMLKTIDTIHALFIKELASISKKANLSTDILPASNTLTSLTKANLETVFSWQE